MYSLLSDELSRLDTWSWDFYQLIFIYIKSEWILCSSVEVQVGTLKDAYLQDTENTWNILLIVIEAGEC